MNLKSFAIITIMFFVVLPQGIATEQTIKPIVEIPLNNTAYIKTFIGFEGEGVYKKAQLYGLTTKNTIKKLQNFQFILPEDDTNYFVTGLLGDISGEGQKDFILILTNPNSGTRLYTWTIDQNNQFSRLTKPYTIKNNQTESYPTTSSLGMIYPDKDQEIIISFGSPDRKTIILDYIGEIKQTETVGKNLLSNLAGPIILKTEDFNKDSLDDLYLLNNGEEIIEALYLSPQREETNIKKTTLKDRVLDLYIYKQEDTAHKIFLLKNQKLFFDTWKKEIPITPKNPKKILLINNNILSIINKKGEIQHYTINDKTETITKTNLVSPNFKNKKYNTIHYLVLEDKENILISHDVQSEILLQPLYYNIEPEKQNQENKKETQKTETANTTKEQKTRETKESTEKRINEQNIIKAEKNKQELQTITLSQDTIAVNIGQQTNIKINLNPNHTFLNLKTIKKPKKMQFNVSSLSFEWLPSNKEAGYHPLQYDITYNQNIGIKKEETEGELRIINETKKRKEIKNYVVFVNSPPSIKTPQKKYSTQSQSEVKITLKASDLNKNQKLLITHKPQKKGFQIKKDTFSWTPQNNHFGENKIEFFVFDGMLYDSTTVIITVDTLKQEVVNEDLIVTTVNKEFIYQLSQKNKPKYSLIKGPQNLRVSNTGEIHWIPINTQLGNNEIIIEIKENNQNYNYSMGVFVNAPPIISYRPNKIEYIKHNEVFSFQTQTFDQNTDQELFWNLTKGPKDMDFTNGKIEWKGSTLDYNNYSIELTDTINKDVFNGKIYVNEKPKLINNLPNYITLGEKLNHTLEVQDNNKINPKNGKKEKHTTINILSSPKNMETKNNKLIWTPTINDIGEHEIILEVSDGLETTKNKLNIFVNDIPQITSADSLKIKVGDTLKHFLKAKDLNQNTTLTYSISANLKNMMLNAQTGEITWTPTISDLGKHEILVNVSDGLTANKNNQTIQIFVYALPKFIKGPPKEGYVNIEYSHIIEAQDGFGKTSLEKDIYISIDTTTINNIIFKPETGLVSMTPTIEQTGPQNIILELKDNYNNSIKENFTINILISPCETADSTHYKKTQTLEKKVSEYEKVIQIIESPTSTIDTLYSINFSKRELRQEKRKEKKEAREQKRKEKKEARQQKRKKRKEKNTTTARQDTIFITQLDTIYNTISDTVYNKNTSPKDKQLITKKQEKQTATQQEEQKETREENISPPTPVTIMRKETVVIEKKETIIVDLQTTKTPPPYGQKVAYNTEFEEQKWGEAGIKKKQKTATSTTLLNYTKSWK